MLTLVSGGCLSVQHHPKEQSEHSLVWLLEVFFPNPYISFIFHLREIPDAPYSSSTATAVFPGVLALKVSPLWISEIVLGLQTQSGHVQGSSDCFLLDCSSTLDKVDRQFLSRCSLDTSLSLVFSPEWNLSPLSGCSALCGSLWIFPWHHSLQFFTLFFSGLVKFI